MTKSYKLNLAKLGHKTKQQLAYTPHQISQKKKTAIPTKL